MASAAAADAGKERELFDISKLVPTTKFDIFISENYQKKNFPELLKKLFANFEEDDLDACLDSKVFIYYVMVKLKYADMRLFFTLLKVNLGNSAVLDQEKLLASIRVCGKDKIVDFNAKIVYLVKFYGMDASYTCMPDSSCDLFSLVLNKSPLAFLDRDVSGQVAINHMVDPDKAKLLAQFFQTNTIMTSFQRAAFYFSLRPEAQVVFLNECKRLDCSRAITDFLYTGHATVPNVLYKEHNQFIDKNVAPTDDDIEVTYLVGKVSGSESAVVMVTKPGEVKGFLYISDSIKGSDGKVLPGFSIDFAESLINYSCTEKMAVDFIADINDVEFRDMCWLRLKSCAKNGFDDDYPKFIALLRIIYFSINLTSDRTEFNDLQEVLDSLKQTLRSSRVSLTGEKKILFAKIDEAAGNDSYNTGGAGGGAGAGSTVASNDDYYVEKDLEAYSVYVLWELLSYAIDFKDVGAAQYSLRLILTLPFENLKCNPLRVFIDSYGANTNSLDLLSTMPLADLEESSLARVYKWTNTVGWMDAELSLHMDILKHRLEDYLPKAQKVVEPKLVKVIKILARKPSKLVALYRQVKTKAAAHLAADDILCRYFNGKSLQVYNTDKQRLLVLNGLSNSSFKNLASKLTKLDIHEFTKEKLPVVGQKQKVLLLLSATDYNKLLAALVSKAKSASPTGSTTSSGSGASVRSGVVKSPVHSPRRTGKTVNNLRTDKIQKTLREKEKARVKNESIEAEKRAKIAAERKANRARRLQVFIQARQAQDEKMEAARVAEEKRKLMAAKPKGNLVVVVAHSAAARPVAFNASATPYFAMQRQDMFKVAGVVSSDGRGPTLGRGC